MKKSGLYTLLFFWVFAILAPAIITIIDNNNVIVVSNINEEENQNSAKKLVGEKDLVPNKTEALFAALLHIKKTSHPRYILGTSNYILDINLPPPECLS